MSAEIREVVALSFQVAITAMIITVPMAIAVGYLLATRRFPGWGIVNAICHLPLVLPPVITGFILLQIFRPNGLLGQTLTAWFGTGVAFNWMGAAIAAAVMSFPLVMRPIRLAFELQEPAAVEVAKTLGAGKFKAFTTISLPAALPGIIAGGVLGFAKSMGEFGATITFVSNIPGETRTIALAVYSFMQSPSGDGAALALIVIGVAVSFFAILLSEWLAARLSYREGAGRA